MKIANRTLVSRIVSLLATLAVLAVLYAYTKSIACTVIVGLYSLVYDVLCDISGALIVCSNELSDISKKICDK